MDKAQMYPNLRYRPLSTADVDSRDDLQEAVKTTAVRIWSLPYRVGVLIVFADEETLTFLIGNCCCCATGASYLFSFPACIYIMQTQFPHHRNKRDGRTP